MKGSGSNRCDVMTPNNTGCSSDHSETESQHFTQHPAAAQIDTVNSLHSLFLISSSLNSMAGLLTLSDLISCFLLPFYDNND
jgi:hypothetical protein